MKFISLPKLQEFWTKVKARLDLKFDKAGGTVTGATTFNAAITAKGGVVGNASSATTATSASTATSATTATKLSASKTFSLNGDATGSVSSDLSGNVSIPAQVLKLHYTSSATTESNCNITATTADLGCITYRNMSSSATNAPTTSIKLLHMQTDNAAYAAQVALSYGTGQIYTRALANSTYTAWRTQIDSSNYTSYVPAKPAVFNNVSVATSAWVATTSANQAYTSMPYQATISTSGVTATSTVEVIFSPKDADSGNFSGGGITAANAITLFASEIPSAALTIPKIIAWNV